MANIVGADSTIICFRKEIFEYLSSLHCEHCDEMLKGKAEMREHDTTIHGGIVGGTCADVNTKHRQ